MSGWPLRALLVAALGLVACGSGVPRSDDAVLPATITALQGTIPSLETTVPPDTEAPGPATATTATVAPMEQAVSEQITVTPASSTPGATAAAVEGEAPVTPIMRRLELAGEPFAAVGDPNAPLTVIEFSDYG